MGSGGQGEVIGPDFVGDIAISSHPIASHQNHIHLTATHQQPAGAINDDGARDPKVSQLHAERAAP